jgi:hypothetical protein
MPVGNLGLRDGHREEIELSGFAGGSLLAVFWLKFKKEDSGT